MAEILEQPHCLQQEVYELFLFFVFLNVVSVIFSLGVVNHGLSSHLQSFMWVATRMPEFVQ